MPVVVAEGVVVVEADASGIPRQVARDIDGDQAPVEQAGRNMGRSIFGGIVGAWAAIGGTQMLTGFFSGAVTGASDLNETVSKGEAIFGAQSGAMRDWSSNAAQAMGLSQSAALAAASGYGDMFLQLGFAGDQAAQMSRDTVQLAADLGSFNNLETADVSDRISAAFRGEYDSLQALIPNINAARVEQEALAATGKTSASELTAQEKAAATLAIVQRDGARAMGDFERTSDGAANQAKIATASLEDQQAKLGGLLLPAWTDFLGFLNTQAIPGLGAVVDWLGENGDTVQGLAITLGIGAAAWGVYRGVVALSTAYQVAAAGATGGLTVAQWLLNAAMSANPIGIVIIALTALVAGIVWVATQTTFFQDVWAGFTSFIGTAATWLWESVISPVFTAIGNVFTWLWTNAIEPLRIGFLVAFGIMAGIVTWLWQAAVQPVFAAIGGIFNWVWANVISPVVGWIVGGVQAWGAIFSWLWGNAIQPAINAVGAGFNWVWGNVISPVVGWISGAITNVGNTVRDVFGAISGFVQRAFEGALGVARGPINGLIGLVNGAIRGINRLSVTIPDWVPEVGGQTWGLNIPTIPMLARGTNNAPDMFIAGEQGPELITGARGATVRPYGETMDMLARGVKGGSTVHAPITIVTDDPELAARRAVRLLTDRMGA